MSQIDCGLDNGCRVFVHDDVGDERTVDFQIIDGKGGQIAERRIAGSEIVYGNGNAHFTNFRQSGTDCTNVFDQAGFRDFQFEKLW